MSTKMRKEYLKFAQVLHYHSESLFPEIYLVSYFQKKFHKFEYIYIYIYIHVKINPF